MKTLALFLSVAAFSGAVLPAQGSYVARNRFETTYGTNDAIETTQAFAAKYRGLVLELDSKARLFGWQASPYHFEMDDVRQSGSNRIASYSLEMNGYTVVTRTIDQVGRHLLPLQRQQVFPQDVNRSYWTFGGMLRVRGNLEASFRLNATFFRGGRACADGLFDGSLDGHIQVTNTLGLQVIDSELEFGHNGFTGPVTSVTILQRGLRYRRGGGEVRLRTGNRTLFGVEPTWRTIFWRTWKYEIIDPYLLHAYL